MAMLESDPAEVRRERTIVAVLRGRRVPTYVARTEHDPSKLLVVEHLAVAPSLQQAAIERAAMVTDTPHPRLTRIRLAIARPGGVDVVSDFIDGESLANLRPLLRAKGIALPAMCTLRIISDVLSGLNALHRMSPFAAHGHGEVSPHNVIVGLDGRVRLVEIIRGTDGARRDDASRFAAPETLGGGPTAPASDLYAVGVLLADLLGTNGEHSEYTDAFLEVSRRARASAPADRFVSAAEMLSALASHFRDRPPLHGDVARLMTSLVGDAVHARRLALETAPIMQHSELRRALSPPASMPVTYLAPEASTGSPRASERSDSMEPGAPELGPDRGAGDGARPLDAIPPTPRPPSSDSSSPASGLQVRAPGRAGDVARHAAPNESGHAPASQRYASARPLPPPRATVSVPSPEMSVVVAPDPVPAIPTAVAVAPNAPLIGSTALPPMRAQQVTSPDLTLATLAAAEREQRSPRLLILCITILLVGIAVGVLWKQGAPATPPQNTAAPTGRQP